MGFDPFQVYGFASFELDLRQSLFGTFEVVGKSPGQGVLGVDVGEIFVATGRTSLKRAREKTLHKGLNLPAKFHEPSGRVFLGRNARLCHCLPGTGACHF